jgi:hypothetical protein
VLGARKVPGSGGEGSDGDGQQLAAIGVAAHESGCRRGAEANQVVDIEIGDEPADHDALLGTLMTKVCRVRLHHGEQLVDDRGERRVAVLAETAAVPWTDRAATRGTRSSH